MYPRNRENIKSYTNFHCLKIVQIRGFSSLYFPAFGLNMEIYRVNLSIQSKDEKIQTRKTPYLNTFHALFWAVSRNVLLT